MVKPKAKQHYVDSKKFLTEYVRYATVRDDAVAQGLPKPPITDYLGDCIQKICTHLAFKPNFINYSFRDDMIADAIENCLMYFDNFDPAISTQIFSYYTQTAYFAFLRRIAIEKKQTYIKHKFLEHTMLFDVLASPSNDDDSAMDLKANLNNDYMNDFVTNYEQSLEKTRAAVKSKKKVKEAANTVLASLEDIPNG